MCWGVHILKVFVLKGITKGISVNIGLSYAPILILTCNKILTFYIHCLRMPSKDVSCNMLSQKWHALAKCMHVYMCTFLCNRLIKGNGYIFEITLSKEFCFPAEHRFYSQGKTALFEANYPAGTQC